MRSLLALSAALAVSFLVPRLASAGWCPSGGAGGAGAGKIGASASMGARGSGSVASLPQFRVNWRDVLNIKEDVITGMTEEQAKATLRHDSPLMVYVYDDNVEDQRYDIETHKAMADDRVLVGTRFFDCVRIDLESAREEAVLKSVKRAPALVFLRPDYKVSKTLYGKLTSKRVFGAMMSTVKKDYSNCIDCVYKAQKKLTKKWNAHNAEMAKLQALSDKIADEPRRAKRTQLIRQRDKMQEELGKAQDALAKQEAELYALKVKEKKAT